MQDSNLRHAVYNTAVLPTELMKHTPPLNEVAIFFKCACRSPNPLLLTPKDYGYTYKITAYGRQTRMLIDNDDFSDCITNHKCGSQLIRLSACSPRSRYMLFRIHVPLHAGCYNKIG